MGLCMLPRMLFLRIPLCAAIIGLSLLAGAQVKPATDTGKPEPPTGMRQNQNPQRPAGTPGTGTLLITAKIVTPDTATPGATLSCPCTLFGQTGPTNTASGADKSVELGMQFTDDIGNSVTALRFFKMAGETGTHVGNLWDANHQLLATVTFTNETTSGWQQQMLPTPVRLTVGATYTASYHTTNGFYAHDSNFFTQTFNNAPLHGVKGAYSYGTGAFPNNATGTNYYVDVVVSQYVTLSWNPSTTTGAPLLYNLYRSTTSKGENFSVPLAQGIACPVAPCTYVDATVASGNSYYYQATTTVQSGPSNEAGPVAIQ